MLDANRNLEASKACIDLIKSSEGCRFTSYKDAVGVWTIGYGSTIDVHPGLTITQDEANDRLHAAVADCEESLKTLANVPLTQGQFDALVDFIYNLGARRLADSTLLKKLNAGYPKDAADEFKKWVFAGHKILPGLVKRREAERLMFIA